MRERLDELADKSASHQVRGDRVEVPDADDEVIVVDPL